MNVSLVMSISRGDLFWAQGRMRASVWRPRRTWEREKLTILNMFEPDFDCDPVKLLKGNMSLFFDNRRRSRAFSVARRAFTYTIWSRIKHHCRQSVSLRRTQTFCCNLIYTNINEVVFHRSILQRLSVVCRRDNTLTLTVMRLTRWRTQATPPVATQ